MPARKDNFQRQMEAERQGLRYGRPPPSGQGSVRDQTVQWKTRKRQRVSAPRRKSEPEEDAPMIATMRRPLCIAHTSEVWKFYDQQFRNCQQSACKLIAKAWIKVVEPKKQSNYPYTGNLIPDWWPRRYGPKPTDVLRFKEPDHLYRDGE